MKEEVFYYDGFGQPCDEKDAWSMHIVSEDGMCMIAGCNGHQAGERRVLTQEEEIEILKPWAAGHEYRFDDVLFVAEVEQVRVYSLIRNDWTGHKTGWPFFAIVENGHPRIIRPKGVDKKLFFSAYASY